ncbi:MAG TPA: hypothetical protein VHE33_03280, partial [Acidobacteriaceae bacterium]|nr:hypothetical protein [Acidobacteriaceae bacterium]
MTRTLKALATLALTAAVATGFAQTTASSPGTKKVHRKVAPKGPTVQQQIEELRQQQQADHGQIDNLKQ